MISDKGVGRTAPATLGLLTRSVLIAEFNDITWGGGEAIIEKVVIWFQQFYIGDELFFFFYFYQEENILWWNEPKNDWIGDTDKDS